MIERFAELQFQQVDGECQADQCQGQVDRFVQVIDEEVVDLKAGAHGQFLDAGADDVIEDPGEDDVSRRWQRLPAARRYRQRSSR